MPEQLTLEEQIESLKAQLADVKKPKDLMFKVSPKGAVSVYGMGRFPVTLYYEQWQRLLDRKADLLDFMAENIDKLARK